MKKIIIDGRHQGPFGAANGGYVSGILGEALGGAPSTVRLHEAVPVDTPVYLYRRGDTAFIRHEGRTIATAETVTDDLPTTAFVTPDEVSGAELPDLDLGMFSGCFVCGQQAPEGLGLDLRRLGDGRFAALWRPAESRDVTEDTVPAVILRSALDCPGGFAALSANRVLAVTGTLTSRIDKQPASDSTLVVIGEATHAEGRKLGAVSTIYTERGELVATASAIWIALPASPVEAGQMAVA